MNTIYGYKKGLKDSIAIALAYLAVSFTFGIKVTEAGLKPILAILISATNLTSAGQFAGVDIIIRNESLAILFFTVLLINARYLLMSTAITQYLPEKTSTKQRLFISFFVTDEIFALSDLNKKNFSIKYFLGIATLPYFAWTIGTIIGSFAKTFLPTTLVTALNIAIYCMFIALIIPPAKKSFGITLCILIATSISCLFYFVKPLYDNIPIGIQIIISSLLSAIICAIIFPHNDEEIEIDKTKIKEQTNE